MQWWKSQLGCIDVCKNDAYNPIKKLKDKGIRFFPTSECRDSEERPTASVCISQCTQVEIRELQVLMWVPTVVWSAHLQQEESENGEDSSEKRDVCL